MFINKVILENSLRLKCNLNSRTLHDIIVSLMESNIEVRYELVKEVPYEGPTIAIDLGTSYAYVAVPDNGKALILTHENGEKAYPCFISFTENERLIGVDAKAQAAKNPQNTVFDFKRMIGKSFNDPILQTDLKKWPFKVEPDERNRPKVVVTYKGETKKFHPEELTAMILVRLKEAAEKFLKTPVKKAVITVPAYFRDSQRQATRDAANLAGLSVSRLINQPAAAAVAYGMSSHFPKGEVKLLVYELGAGTFDASVVNIQDGFIQILSTVGDTHLGAQDFDNRLVEVCAEQFKKDTGIDLHNNWAVLHNLRKECSKVRRTLVKEDHAEFKIENLIEGKPFEFKITRKDWENICEPILGKTVGLINKVLEDAKLETKNINQVILAGGATHSSMVTDLVKKLFPGHQPIKSINPDQAVVLGAALLAHDISSDSKDKKDNSLLLINVLPMSLGVEGPQGAMMVVIPRDTPIPTIRHHTFTTTEDNQQMILVTIYEGENKLVKDNHILGTFKLSGIPAAAKGSPAIEIMIHVDADGVLELKAVDKDNAKEIDTPVLRWTLSKGEVQQLKQGGFYYEQTQMPKKPSKMDEVD